MSMIKGIADNFIRMFQTDNTFVKANQDEIYGLKSLNADRVSAFMEFYLEYNPNNVKMTDSYVTLLSIERMLAEKATGEGRYLSDIGFIVFAITVGGNPICLDVNATKNGDAPVYICNHNLCSWNEKYGYEEIGWPSEKLMEKITDKSRPIELTYENALLCVKLVENSFVEFMKKLSENIYDDLEGYLD